MFVDYDVARLRCNLRHDCITVEVFRLRARLLGDARILPCPRSGVPAVVSPRPGGIDHGKSTRPRCGKQFRNGGDTVPGLGTAGRAPALDRFKDRFGPLPAERIVDVDHHHRRPLAVALGRAKAACREHLLVALGQIAVPHLFSFFHVSPLIIR